MSQPLQKNGRLALADHEAHYLTNVLRLKQGDVLSLFNPTDGEWLATIHDIRKKQVTVLVLQSLRPARSALDMMVCFAPVKGGRLETILEKATELGASVLQPVITARTIVDKVNLERAGSIVREAAEQCERTDWPEIREPMKLTTLLGSWPEDRMLIYGDESGASKSITQTLEIGVRSPKGEPERPGAKRRETSASESTERGAETTTACRLRVAGATALSAASEAEGRDGNKALRLPAPKAQQKWAILTGPEGGFTPEEFALLRRIEAAHGVGLGPRILRADTAVITLCTLTAALWGDWDVAPHFEKEPS